MAVIMGAAAGSQWLAAVAAAKIALALLIPAISVLNTAGITHKKITRLLAFLTGLILLCLPWPPAAASFGSPLPWGETAEPKKTADNRAIFRVGNRIYQLPEDLDRNMPDLLTAALQPQMEKLCVLVISELPSQAAVHLQKLHWVEKTERLTLLAGTQELFRDRKKYDLIFIQELPGRTPAAGNPLFCYILKNMLNPEGVLAAPAEYSCDLPEYHAKLLPGSGGRIRIWSKVGIPLADSFDKLEKALEKRNAGLAESNLSGIMQTLYELRPPELKLRCSPHHTVTRYLKKIGHYLPETFILLPGILILLLGICWLSRSPRYGENLAIFVHGAACMLCLLTLLQAAEKYQFFLSAIPLGAFFGFIALALPHRSPRSRPQCLAAMLCAALAGTVMLAVPLEKLAGYGVPGILPAAVLLPGIFLLASALRCGSTHNGSESTRYLHFAGLLTGAVLSILTPHWAVLLTALLLFAA